MMKFKISGLNMVFFQCTFDTVIQHAVPDSLLLANLSNTVFSVYEGWCTYWCTAKG